MQSPSQGDEIRLPTTRVDGLQGIRAVAIAGVFVVHFGLGSGGFIGVSVFFVLSGFLITTLLLEEHNKTGGIALRSFYVRRVARLLPASVLAIVGTTALALSFGWGQTKPTVLGGATGLLYVSNWAATLTDRFLGFTNFSWSLAQEEQYYLLAPLVLIRFLPREVASAGKVVLGGGAVLALARAVAVVIWPEHWVSTYHNPILNMDGLLVGSGLAMVLSQRPQGIRWLRAASRPPMALASVIVLVLAYRLLPLSATGLAIGVPVATIVCVLLIGSVSHHPGGSADRLLSCGPARWVGDRSYGLYLYQIAVINVWAMAGLPRLSSIILATATCLIVAEASFRCLEAPLRHRIIEARGAQSIRS